MQQNLVDFATHLVDEITSLRHSAERGTIHIETLVKARNLWAFTFGGRAAEQNEHERMTSEEYTLYALGKCSRQTEYGTGRSPQYCRKPVDKMHYGPFMRRVECEEHVKDIIDNYGVDHLR